jgi:ribosomal protein S18 acetylase RimI-like enzyme
VADAVADLLGERTNPGPAPVTLRDMTVADVFRVAEIERQSFSDAWTPSAFHDLLERDYARLRVAEDTESTVQGFRLVGRRRNYYQQPTEDALVLRRTPPETVGPPA